MNGQDQQEVLAELRRIVRLLSLLATQNLNQRQQIEKLSAIGFQPKEIADLIGTTPNTVSVTLTSLRRERGSGGRRSPRATGKS